MSNQQLRHNPRHDQIIAFLKDNINNLSYQELTEMVEIKFGYKFSCQETLIYHLKKNDIIKGEAVKFRMKNIKGLRKIFERDMFKLEKLKEGGVIN